MTTETKQIMNALGTIKQELDYIKANMVDREMFLDAKEMKILEESFENEKRGELVSQEELEEELGV